MFQKSSFTLAVTAAFMITACSGKGGGGGGTTKITPPADPQIDPSTITAPNLDFLDFLNDPLDFGELRIVSTGDLLQTTAKNFFTISLTSQSQIDVDKPVISRAAYHFKSTEPSQLKIFRANTSATSSANCQNQSVKYYLQEVGADEKRIIGGAVALKPLTEYRLIAEASLSCVNVKVAGDFYAWIGNQEEDAELGVSCQTEDVEPNSSFVFLPLSFDQKLLVNGVDLVSHNRICGMPTKQRSATCETILPNTDSSESSQTIKSECRAQSADDTADLHASIQYAMEDRRLDYSCSRHGVQFASQSINSCTMQIVDTKKVKEILSLESN